MKVLYFTRTQSPHDLRFTQALSETPHQVSVLCLEPDAAHVWPQGIQEIAWSGIDTKHGWLKMCSQVGRLRKVLDELNPDLVHAGPIQGPAYLTALAGFHPLVSMSWGSDLMVDADRNLLMVAVTRYTLSKTDVLVGDCVCVGQKANKFGFNQQRYFKFPWGVDLAHFAPTGTTNLREKLGWQNKIVLLSTRSWEPVYGLNILIPAFIDAFRVNPDLCLIMLGKNLKQTGYYQWITDCVSEDQLFFGGLVSLEELPDVYRSADLYLSASHSDGSSVSLMEAMACGLPVVVSDIPGNREWVCEGEQGWLFKDGSVEEMTQKILQAAAQVKSLNHIKKGNRSLAESRADWTKNFPVLLQAYEMAIKMGAQHG